MPRRAGRPDPASSAAGAAELRGDPDRPGGWQLDVDGVAQSYVDVADPTYLAFDYVRRIGDVIDAVDPPGSLRVVHVGGAALTLPRYVAATRPRSRQLVLEPDAALVELVRERLPWGRAVGIRVRVAEGRAAVATLRDASADLMVLDAFVGGRLPGHLVTAEAMRDAARVLGPQGTYVLNVGDGPPLRFARRVVATLFGVWPHVALVADPGVLRGRRYGNLILAASQVPLPLAELSRRAAGAAFPARVVHGDALARLVSGAAPSTDADPAPSPDPPPDLWR